MKSFLKLVGRSILALLLLLGVLAEVAFLVWVAYLYFSTGNFNVVYISTVVSFLLATGAYYLVRFANLNPNIVYAYIATFTLYLLLTIGALIS